MAALVISWIANSLAIYAVAQLLRGVDVASFADALIAGGVLTLINAIVKPILVLLTLPLTILTLGLFYFLVTAFCLWLAAQLVPGFILQGTLRTIAAAILISICSALIGSVLGRATSDSRRRR